VAGAAAGAASASASASASATTGSGGGGGGGVGGSGGGGGSGGEVAAKPWAPLDVAYVATRDIAAGEELFVDYDGGQRRAPWTRAWAAYLQALEEEREVKNVGTFYVGRGGVEGVPPELWRALSALVGEEEDQEQKEEQAAAEDGEGGGAVEVGMEEFQVLHDFVGTKLQQLEASEPAAEAALARVGAGDPRCAFVRHYRDGQREILKELLSALVGVLAEADDTGEDDGNDEA